MLNSFVIGSYYSTGSYIQKCHPLIKIICSLLLIISIVISNSIFSFLLLLIVSLVLLYLSKIPYQFFIKAINSSKYFLVGILFINFVFSGNLIIGMYITFKMIFIAIVSEILLFSTSISDMLNGLKSFFSPLNYIKISSNKIALSLTFSLHFIPILLSQAERVIKSQVSRGLRYKDMSLKSKLSAFSSTITQLISLSLKRADIVADALEVRNFDLNRSRSSIDFRKINIYDIITIILFVLCFIMSFF